MPPADTPGSIVGGGARTVVTTRTVVSAAVDGEPASEDEVVPGAWAVAKATWSEEDDTCAEALTPVSGVALAELLSSNVPWEDIVAENTADNLRS